MDINVVWLQKLWPLLRHSGPLISRLAETYVKRGADRKTAENLAGTAVIVDQVLEERLKDLAQADDLHALRREVAELRALIEQRGLPRRRPLLLFLVIGELIIIALLLYFGIHS
ncbi:MAG: hypothetical protein PHO57_01010 [Acidithiobacillus sp.]|uniref:hypothetical protein n=1 Tax=Acidithiobacillus sp. AMEEHan TaxID=2994951 RepID=UPI00182911E7|nr:hypothetical protein [Acidithiobacillus sp. AMEEHan]MDD3759394.1 hypothetical protein [Acidithiobacillus sp.]